MRSRPLPLVVAVLCAGIAMPARAASAAEPVEVARAGKVALLAGDQKQRLCIGVADDLGLSCADANAGVVTVSGAGTGDPPYLGAAVPAAAARVEVRRAGVLLADGPTVAGEAYKGVRAGSVRFALLALPKTARTDGLRVRALNAAGALVSVLAGDDDPELIVRRTRLLSGRARGVRWSVFAEEQSELTPSVLDLGHETVSRCVSVVLNTVDWGRPCEGGLPLRSLDLFGSSRAASAETCNPPYRVLYGLVDASVTVVTVLLGNGRRRNVATVPISDSARAYAVATGANAVRSVTLPGRGVVRPGFAPLSAVCAGGGLGLTLLNLGAAALGPFASLASLPPVTPTGPVTTIPGTPAMQVADGPADTLCIGFVGRPFDGLGCDIISPLVGETQGTLDNLFDPHAFALAVQARVAAVRLSNADRTVVRVLPTVPGTGYRGRYAGYVRFVAASVSNADELTRFELLDAAGTVLSDDSEDDDEVEVSLPRVGRPRRVAGRAGGPSLWQTNVRFDKVVEHCLALTGGPVPGPLENCQASGADTTVLLDASCVTHRLSVGIVVRAGTRVVADTGRTPRPVRLRRGRAMLTLPEGRPLRSLTFIRKGRKRRAEIGAPAGAKQCGWHLSPAVDDL